MARPVQPVEIRWGNSVTNIITQLNVVILEDNLEDCCVIAYTTLNDNNELISTARLRIEGNNYHNWDGNNDYPYIFTADYLNLILIETTTTTSTTTTTTTEEPTTTSTTTTTTTEEPTTTSTTTTTTTVEEPI